MAKKKQKGPAGVSQWDKQVKCVGAGRMEKGNFPGVEACVTIMLHREQRQWRTKGVRPNQHRCAFRESEGCKTETSCDKKPSAGKEKKFYTLRTKNDFGAGGSSQGCLGCSSE